MKTGSVRIIKLQRIYFHYQAAIQLRYDLFFRPHDLPEAIVFDEREKDSRHFALSWKIPWWPMASRLT